MGIQEFKTFRLNGFLMLLVAVAMVAGTGWLGAAGIVRLDDHDDPSWFIAALVAALFTGLVFAGLVVVQPNEARVLTFFGKYAGSVRDPGFHWVNPLTAAKKVTLRVRNFNSEHLKVNDASGNPIEIGAVVVWSVVDAAKAVLEVEAYEQFVSIQSETAIRTLAQHYPYDTHDEQSASLRGSPDEIAHALQTELSHKLLAAGVQVLDARITHLAYAPEIAQAMLRRQQAQAVIAARKQIVEGAVSMVTMALERLAANNVVELDEERKAAMVSNLLVVLVGETETKPVINTGSLY